MSGPHSQTAQQPRTTAVTRHGEMGFAPKSMFAPSANYLGYVCFARPSYRGPNAAQKGNEVDCYYAAENMDNAS